MSAQPAKIVIAVGDESSAIEPRIKVELESMGFPVLMMEVDPGVTNPQQVLGRAAGAGAVILCLKSKGYVEIWIEDRVTGKIVLRRVEIPVGEDDIDAVVALGTVELLRASFLEVRTSHMARGSVRPTAPVQQLAAPRAEEKARAEAIEPVRYYEERISTEISAALLLASKEAPPMMDLMLGVHWRVLKPLGISVFGMIPLVASQVDEVEGAALVRLGTIGAGLRLTWFRQENPWSLNLGAGWTAIMARINGNPLAGYTSAEQHIATSAPYIRLGVGVVVVPRVVLRLDVLSGWMISELRIQYRYEDELENRVVATYGHFLVSAMLGIEFRIW